MNEKRAKRLRREITSYMKSFGNSEPPDGFFEDMENKMKGLGYSEADIMRASGLVSEKLDQADHRRRNRSQAADNGQALGDTAPSSDVRLDGVNL
jgi:hypothetical protein